jgi:hypothetical protein
MLTESKLTYLTVMPAATLWTKLPKRILREHLKILKEVSAVLRDGDTQQHINRNNLSLPQASLSWPATVEEKGVPPVLEQQHQERGPVSKAFVS